MDKKLLFSLLGVVVIVGLLGAVAFGSKNRKNNSLPDSQTPILYYGVSCPHCKTLDEKITASNLEKTISIIRKEIYLNKKNSQEFVTVAKSCGLTDSEMLVPFLYAEKKCLVGTDAIYEYLVKETEKEATISAETER